MNAFSSIRLSGKSITVSGDRLFINGSGLVRQSETGVFLSQGGTGLITNGNISGQVISGTSGYFQNRPSVNGSGISLSGEELQTLSFNTATAILSISNGNSLSLGQFLETGDADSRYAQSSLTGSFITSSQTGQFQTSGSYVQNSQTGAFVTTGQTGTWVTSGNTGNFVTNSQTGVFVTTGYLDSLYYPRTNPSGFGAGGGGGIQDLSFNTSTEILGITSGASVSLGIYLTTGKSDARYAQSSATGLFITTGQTGQFQAVGNYVQISQTGIFVTSGQTGGFVTVGQTGAFATTGLVESLYYPRSNPSGFGAGGGGSQSLSFDTNTELLSITSGNSVSLGIYLTTGKSDNRYAQSSMTGIFVSSGQTGTFATQGQLGQYVLSSSTGSLSGSFASHSQTGNFVTQGQISNFVSQNQTGALSGSFVSHSQTGNFVTQGQTGVFANTGWVDQYYYPRSNPSGFSAGGGGLVQDLSFNTSTELLSITSGNSVSLGTYLTTGKADARYAQSSQTGIFVTTGQTGNYATQGQLSSYVLSSTTGASLSGSFVSKTSTGAYSGSFVSHSQTGNYVTQGQTGNFMTSGSSGSFKSISLLQNSLGQEVFRIESEATNDNPKERVFQNRVTTTDATATTIHAVPIPTSHTVGIEATVIARRTGGAAGTAEDGGFFKTIAQYNNIAGVATIIGSNVAVAANSSTGTISISTVSDGAGNALIQVTGDADTDIVWHATVRTYLIST